MNVWIAAYKGKYKGLSAITGFLIRYVTRGPYSHVEIVIGNSPFEENVDCISASAMDKGVRLKRMVLKEENWELIPLPEKYAEIAYDWYNRYRGQGYDYLGAFRFMLPFLLKEHPKNWFCSEACADILKIKDPWRFDPTQVMVITQTNPKE